MELICKSNQIHESVTLRDFHFSAVDCYVNYILRPLKRYHWLWKPPRLFRFFTCRDKKGKSNWLAVAYFHKFQVSHILFYDDHVIQIQSLLGWIRYYCNNNEMDSCLSCWKSWCSTKITRRNSIHSKVGFKMMLLSNDLIPTFCDYFWNPIKPRQVDRHRKLSLFFCRFTWSTKILPRWGDNYAQNKRRYWI